MSVADLSLRLKWVRACAALVQHNAQSPYVTLCVVWLALTKLWGQVVWCANEGLCKALWTGQDLHKIHGLSTAAFQVPLRAADRLYCCFTMQQALWH